MQKSVELLACPPPDKAMHVIAAILAQSALFGGRAILSPPRAGAITATIDGHFAVGVLAVQGGFAEHMAAIKRQSGVVGREVRVPSDLEGIDALILPGGESTAQGHCMVEAHLLQPVRAFAQSKPVWGVCAGMILLADGLTQEEPQALVGGLHATVERNAFGRQVDSRFRAMDLCGSAAEAGVAAASYFIRAPAFAKVGEGVEVLATLPDGNKPVAVRQDKLLATCFHPEISGDDSWLHYFLNSVAGANVDTSASAPYPAPAVTAPWSPNPAPGSDVDVAVKRAFAVFQKGGVIMDVVNGEQARIAEEAGAPSPSLPFPTWGAPAFSHPLPTPSHPRGDSDGSTAHPSSPPPSFLYSAPLPFSLRRGGRDGPGAHPRRHQARRRRGALLRPGHDQGRDGAHLAARYGQGAHRTLL
jgi:pyridoxal 5'-phosphate synthase glutaminase subunit Pdx2